MHKVCRKGIPRKITKLLQNMPLLINGGQLGKVTEGEVFKQFPSFMSEAKSLCNSDVQQVESKRALYVNQREYAVISPSDDKIDIIGTDDATTCHIIVFRHTGSGIVCLSHLDGWKTKHCIDKLVTDFRKMASGGPEGKLEVYLYGGFMDSRGESEKLTKEVLESLECTDAEFHLQMLCTCHDNNIVKEGVNFPVIYGVGINVKEFNIFRAHFPDKGPDHSLRSAPIFAGTKLLENIYDNELGQLVIGPYQWDPQPDVQFWTTAPDSLIRKHLSTSPEQEPAGFEANVRKSLLHLFENPTPHTTLFHRGARRYTLQPSGAWTLVS